MSGASGSAANQSESSNPIQVVSAFRQAVIERFSIQLGVRGYAYQEYLALPASERSNDEADAVDQQFARYVLEWLGFSSSDWNYNRLQAGRKANRPDYSVTASVGMAFIWEDKNSTLDLAEEHLLQMRRYAIGTAGYAVWCNMRRILAVRFSSNDTLKYEILADISIETLLGTQVQVWQTQATNLALFRLLFGKERFTQFLRLVESISIDEGDFKKHATPLTSRQAMQDFIDGSRQSLDHLRLAALSQIRKAREDRSDSEEEEKTLYQEWTDNATQLVNKLGYAESGRMRVQEAIQRLTARLGEISAEDMNHVKEEMAQAGGTTKLSAAMTSLFEQWREQATHTNSAFLTLRFQLSSSSQIADAYRVWRERQSDKKDENNETFAEQVAYVFFIRMLLVRVLEDKSIIQPRLASDGGFTDWIDYVKKHFQELNGVGILNQIYCNLLTRKAGHYYLHFFQQAVFDWFTPDDFLLVETLEFLCQYNFQHVKNDIIGFTYEEYIDRNARNRKGHFLTRDDVVEYMLDLLEYEGRSVLGRRILDPTCGSGSFLVHAARRYRRALVTALCTQKGLPDSEAALNAHIEWRKELAQNYLEALTKLFFGTELNPFACYLAEMNLLIQGLDDLFVLQQGEDNSTIERFQIFNTNSLDLPREVLSNSDVTGTLDTLWSPRLSDRIVDEAFPIKAKYGEYGQGFFFIVSNPPYINSSQVALQKEYSTYPFYAQVLSGATNTYLLFLRLGMYYLGAGGRMVYIVPLTVIGDASSASARRLLKNSPFRPTRAVRFFSGNVLFPGVDQAVTMLRVDRDVEVEASFVDWDVPVSGGYTVEEARQNEIVQTAAHVFNSTPPSQDWQAAWLVSNNAQSYILWDYVKSIAKSSLDQLWQSTFELRQGDVRSDHVTPFRLGRNHRPVQGDIAIQKGEDVFRYAPLAPNPSDWARPKTSSISDSRNKAVNETLLRVQQLTAPEQGITLRKIARLNTRETLIATWFERDREHPIIFPDEQWRFRLLPQGDVSMAKALLALLNSRIVAYLLNLFSTNNNVAQGELARLLIPDPATFPKTELATLATALLQERAILENEFVLKYGAKLPDSEVGMIYVPPSEVIATTTQFMKISLGGLVEQGIVRNKGLAGSKISSLKARGLLEYTIHDEVYTRILDLFLTEPNRENEMWLQAQSWLFPDPVVATAWLKQYDTIGQRIQGKWDTFIALQQQVDEVVSKWYGFDAAMHNDILRGLPWAKRRRGTSSSVMARDVSE